MNHNNNNNESLLIINYRYDKIVLKKWYTIFKDTVTLGDYEIHDGCSLELYYS